MPVQRCRALAPYLCGDSSHLVEFDCHHSGAYLPEECPSHSHTRATGVFDTSLRDQAIRDRRSALDRERADLLARVAGALRQARASCGLREAFVIGSLAQPERWHQGSDVDVAVGGCSAAVLEVMRILEDATGRAVDVIDLDRHPRPDAVRSRGIPVHE